MRLRRFCAFLTGFVFFISGIFKLLDPVGAGLVFGGGAMWSVLFFGGGLLYTAKADIK